MLKKYLKKEAVCKDKITYYKQDIIDSGIKRLYS